MTSKTAMLSPARDFKRNVPNQSRAGLPTCRLPRVFFSKPRASAGTVSYHPPGFAFRSMSSPVDPAQPAIAPVVTKRSDLEIKDAQLIFGSIWRELEAEFGHEQMRFPKEIILLGGAPGAGKGTNTAFIANVRGLTCSPIVISSLLNSPEARALKDAGNMVGDRDVIGLVLRELLRTEYHDGVILDGFPRTDRKSTRLNSSHLVI